MMSKKLGRFLRKAHRALSIPMGILVLSRWFLTNTALESFAVKLTSITMIFMLVSGLFMYFRTMKVKNKQKVKA